MSQESQPRRLSAEHRLNISRGLTKPGMHERLSRIQHEIWSDPQIRLQHSELIKAALSSPEIRQKISRSHLGVPKSEEVKLKISESLKGKPSKLRGRKIPKIVRDKRSMTMKEKYKNPDFADKMRQVSRISGAERSGSALWITALEENLLPKIIESGLMTESEIERIRANFNIPLNKRRRIPEDLLDRLSIAVARVA